MSKRPTPAPGRARPRARSLATDSEAVRARLAKAARARGRRSFLLRLYVTGTTPASARAIENVRAICEEHLQGRYELEVIDIYQLPSLAKDHQIIAAPTLIRVLPPPLRRFIGDLSRAEKVLFGLDVRPRE